MRTKLKKVLFKELKKKKNVKEKIVKERKLKIVVLVFQYVVIWLLKPVM